jgi:hypothetical protein
VGFSLAEASSCCYVVWLLVKLTSTQQGRT